MIEEQAGLRGRAADLWLRAVLCLLMAFTSVSIDLYLPALPAIGRALAGREGAAALSVTGFLVGFSLGQLLWGPMSDRHGRKRPLLAGLALFVAGSLGCALAQTMPQLVAWRCVEALGASAGIALSRAMVRDIYGHARSAQVLSTLIGVMAVAPLAGPMIGGQILAFASWRALFVVLAGFGALVFAATLALPETLPPPLRTQTPARAWARDLAALLRVADVVRLGGIGALFYCGLFGYIAGTATTYTGWFGLSPQLYGLVYGSSTGAVIVANFVNSRIVPRLGVRRILRAAACTAAAAGCAMVLIGWQGGHGTAALVATWITLTVFAAMVGFIVANSLAGAMAARPSQAGAVSSLVGAAHYGAGIVGSSLVGFAADGSPLPMALVMAATGLAAAWLAQTTLRA